MVDEYVLFVAPSALQIKVYNQILSPSIAQSMIRGAGAQGLAMSKCSSYSSGNLELILPVDLLRKVSNTPLVSFRPSHWYKGKADLHSYCERRTTRAPKAAKSVQLLKQLLKLFLEMSI